MYKKFIILLPLALIIGLPFAFKQDGAALSGGQDKLIIITPHNEALRYEFTRGFKEWYFAKRGRTVDIDWRVPGGTQDCVRLIDALYENDFRLYWEETLGRKWSFKVQEALKNHMNAGLPDIDPLTEEVHDALMTSEISCDMDLFFGGGKVDVVIQAKKGHIVPSEIFERHPEWFDVDTIPFSFGGNNFWDPEKRWVGTSLSGFGVIFNKDVLRDLGYDDVELRQWKDLASEKLIGSVALTDPAGSGVFTMMFEIILQQQMQEYIKEKTGNTTVPDTDPDYWGLMNKGWSQGLQMIQKIAANGRYFTDAATQPVLDVSVGDCAAGMTIDFYGLFQEETLRIRSGSNRFGFVMPKGGTVVSPDPISLFRGAPNKEVAEDFIEYVLSIEGQKLWEYKVGAPGGPKLYNLSRAPIRKELYEGEHLKHRNNPELNLYNNAEGFIYYPEWTAPLFKEIRFAVSVAFIDVHPELVAAWQAIIDARNSGRVKDADSAEIVMQNMKLLSYPSMWNDIKNVLNSGDPLKEVQLRAKFSRHFRNQYEDALLIAQGQQPKWRKNNG